MSGYDCGLKRGESRVEIVLRHNVGEIEDCLKGQTTPKSLVGITGTVQSIQNDAYDCERPTGYERVWLIIQPDKGLTEDIKHYQDHDYESCIKVDYGFCKILTS